MHHKRLAFHRLHGILDHVRELPSPLQKWPVLNIVNCGSPPLRSGSADSGNFCKYRDIGPETERIRTFARIQLIADQPGKQAQMPRLLLKDCVVHCSELQSVQYLAHLVQMFGTELSLTQQLLVLIQVEYHQPHGRCRQLLEQGS